MALKWSPGLVNFVAAKGSLRHAAANARLVLFQGSQPADASKSSTGSTKLATLTKGGGAFTGETRAEWKATLSGAAGTLSALVLGGLVHGGTAQAGAANSITLDTLGSATNDAYNGCYVLITSGAGAGQIRRISDYDGTTKVATVATAWTVNPDANSVFQVIAGVDIMTGAAIAFASTLTDTAAAAVTAINNAITYPDLEAYSSGADLFVKAPRAIGSLFNGLRLYGVGVDGLTVTVANSGQPQTWGVDSVNGAMWLGTPISGEIAKEATAVQGTPSVSGTVSWFRWVFDPEDDGTTESTTFLRLDGLVGVSGADLNLSTTNLTVTAPVVINTFPLAVLMTTT
jgi:hypothetical protein